MLTSPFGSGPDSSPGNPPIFIMNVVITVAILVIIASPIVNAIRRVLLYRYLLRHGTRVDATVTSVWGAEVQFGAAVSRFNWFPGRYGANAKSVDPTTGKERIFTYRGNQRPEFQEGRRVIVLIDPREPSRYAFLR